MKTVLITGCSSGFGLTTANYFLEQGWKVIATMRNPDERILTASEHLRVLALDVTDPVSIQQTIQAAGPIDVLVNNAGIGLLGAVEGSPMDVARELFETNTLGTIAMTQAVLSQFRERQAGVIVNVTSTVVTHAQDVAEAVWRAAVDPTSPMRIAAGADAVELINEQSSAAYT
jgi:NADP-dependent 3-hydroxy acid dehydrogenase YdfG